MDENFVKPVLHTGGVSVTQFTSEGFCESGSTEGALSIFGRFHQRRQGRQRC